MKMSPVFFFFRRRNDYRDCSWDVIRGLETQCSNGENLVSVFCSLTIGMCISEQVCWYEYQEDTVVFQKKFYKNNCAHVYNLSD